MKSRGEYENTYRVIFSEKAKLLRKERAMREIRFRAWDKDNKMWCSDISIGIELCGKIICFPSGEKLKGNLILQQYTGLKDKNGKEIYEGDIVRTDEAGWIAKVIYNTDRFICVDNLNGFSSDCNWELFEVIGNIYENSELLKGGEGWKNGGVKWD